MKFLYLFLCSILFLSLTSGFNGVVINVPSTSSGTLFINSSTTNVNDSQFLRGLTPLEVADLFDASDLATYDYVNTVVIGNATGGIIAVFNVTTDGKIIQNEGNRSVRLNWVNASADVCSNNGSNCLNNIAAGANTSWTETRANTLYGNIIYGYNHTSAVESLYGKWFYNQTLSAINTFGVWGVNATKLDITNITNFNFNYNQTIGMLTSIFTWGDNDAGGIIFTNATTVGLNSSKLNNTIQGVAGSLITGNNSDAKSYTNSQVIGNVTFNQSGANVILNKQDSTVGLGRTPSAGSKLDVAGNLNATSYSLSAKTNITTNSTDCIILSSSTVVMALC